MSENTNDVKVTTGNDDLLGLVKEISDVVKDTANSTAELKEKQVKMEDELAKHVSSTSDRFATAEAQLSTQSDEQDAITKSVFDVVVKDVMVRDMWGYNDPISRAIYKTDTAWSNKQGWHRKGAGYGADDIVMQLNDSLYLMGMHKAIQSQKTGNPMSYSDAVKSFDSYNLFRYELERNSELRKAMDSSTSGEGGAWVPTMFSANLIDDIRLALRVSALFPRITMPAGSGSFDVPVQGARRDAYLVGEATADSGNTAYPAATPPTAKVTFSAIKHGLRILFSDELEEDSAIAIMPLVRSELVYALANAEEKAIINGDTTGTHMDSNVTAGTDIQKSFMGLRKLSGGNSGDAAVNISTLSLANLRSIRQNMGKFGTNPSDLAWVVGLSGYIQMLGLNEVVTVDKFGPSATVTNGTLGFLDGIPIVVSEHIKQDLNATGVYDNTTKTKTVMLLAHKPSFYVAEKPGGLKVESDRDINIGQNIMVASRRFDFEEVISDASGESNVGLGYNLTS